MFSEVGFRQNEPLLVPTLCVSALVERLTVSGWLPVLVMFSVPASEPIVALPVRARRPEIVLVPETFSIAPAPAVPVPARVIPLAFSVIPPES